MIIKKIIDDIQQTDEFLEWSTKNPESSLAHVFSMPDKQDYNLQVGYYNKEKDRITTFAMDDEKIVVNPESKPLKEENKTVKRLEYDRVKIDIDRAIQIAGDYKKLKYPEQKATKNFVILQNIEEGTVYNITILMSSFKTLNIKVDAISGDIVFSDLISVFDFNVNS